MTIIPKTKLQKQNSAIFEKNKVKRSA